MIDYKEGDLVERVEGIDYKNRGVYKGSIHKVSYVKGNNVYLVGRYEEGECWQATYFQKAKNQTVLEIIKDL